MAKEETTAAWRYFPHLDCLGGIQALSLSLFWQLRYCFWLTITHCFKLGKRWPPEANSCRSCNMFMHLLNQNIRGFIWKHLSTLHKLSKNKFPFDAGKQTQKHVAKRKLGWQLMNPSSQGGSVSIWSVWTIKSLYIHGPCLKHPLVI